MLKSCRYDHSTIAVLTLKVKNALLSQQFDVDCTATSDHLLPLKGNTASYIAGAFLDRVDACANRVHETEYQCTFGRQSLVGQVILSRTRHTNCILQRARVPCNRAHATRQVAVLKFGLLLRDTQVGMQEDRGRPANHCAVHSAHDRHKQMTHVDKALSNRRRQSEQGTRSMSARRPVAQARTPEQTRAKPETTRRATLGHSSRTCDGNMLDAWCEHNGAGTV